jgi:hypothetical protein
VWLRGRRIVRHDDERNKAVVWCNRLAFAYTGLAELGRERRTDLWIAQALRDWASETPADEQRQEALLAGLSERATAELARPRFAAVPPSRRQHAFVATGWARFDRGSYFEPYIAVVANYRSDGSSEARDEFEVGVQRLPRDKTLLVHWVGQALGQDEIKRLVALRAMSSTELGPGAASVLAEQVRSVASRNDYVGSGLLINALPKSAMMSGQTEHLLLAGAPEEGQSTFLYMPPDQTMGVQYGPAYVCGGSIASNFEARPF